VVVVVRYIKFVFYLIICFNAMSCAVYMTACPPVLLSEEPLTLLPSQIGQHCIENSWLKDFMDDKTDLVTFYDLYTTSAYFAVVTFMTVGFGVFHAVNFYEVK